MDGETPSPQESNEGLSQRDARVIAAHGDGSDIRDRYERSLVLRHDTLDHHGHPSLAQRVARKRRDLPARRKSDRLAWRQDARIGLGDDVEPLHVQDIISAR